jgi:hypothetical protein
MWKAISWTTASSVCAVIDLVSQGSAESRIFEAGGHVAGAIFKHTYRTILQIALQTSNN